MFYVLTLTAKLVYYILVRHEYMGAVLYLDFVTMSMMPMVNKKYMFYRSKQL